jgi:hypothetical protein
VEGVREEPPAVLWNWGVGIYWARSLPGYYPSKRIESGGGGVGENPAKAPGKNKHSDKHSRLAID